jgi:hypothetical protein
MFWIHLRAYFLQVSQYSARFILESSRGRLVIIAKTDNFYALLFRRCWCELRFLHSLDAAKQNWELFFLIMKVLVAQE